VGTLLIMANSLIQLAHLFSCLMDIYMCVCVCVCVCVSTYLLWLIHLYNWLYVCVEEHFANQLYCELTSKKCK
jgi:hypothetical protein